MLHAAGQNLRSSTVAIQNKLLAFTPENLVAHTALQTNTPISQVSKIDKGTPCTERLFYFIIDLPAWRGKDSHATHWLAARPVC